MATEQGMSIFGSAGPQISDKPKYPTFTGLGPMGALVNAMGAKIGRAHV